ncbi:MAG: 4Fe-4S dicluster domain-containing protein [Desulfovibrionaceae bacterium]|nr:4Fe-4S dicluster domain-containing protein [Desulfovibrionaceae bacterium]MBF0512469.1 4Fe-4S dicluster domain-containing protein [Desulfovibrionaceae bacterium]
MSRVVFLKERCKGCLLCTQVCPKGIIALSGEMNQQGYKIVEVAPGKMEQCTGCASCAMICPDTVITVYKTVKPGQPVKPGEPGEEVARVNG